MKLKYKIFRCYEVAVYDKDDNQIGESEFIYTDRKSAKARAEEMLKEAEDSTSDDENVIYQSGMTTIKRLTEEEAEYYRKMPNGIHQEGQAIHNVAEKDGKKQIIEITADGFSRINVNM